MAARLKTAGKPRTTSAYGRAVNYFKIATKMWSRWGEKEVTVASFPG